MLAWSLILMLASPGIEFWLPATIQLPEVWQLLWNRSVPQLTARNLARRVLGRSQHNAVHLLVESAPHSVSWDIWKSCVHTDQA